MRSWLPLRCWLFALALVAMALAGKVGPTAARAADVDPAVGAFFRTYCLRCHDAQKQEGEFRLDNLPRDFADLGIAQRWSEVVFRINGREMPPRSEPQPRAEEIGAAVEWISGQIKEGEAARLARRGPVAHYRLSREEYGHTIYDLLGVHYDPLLPGALNEDPRWHGFERIGALLSLSPSHVERYLRAAETALGQAFPAKPAKAVVARRAADDGQWQTQGHPGPARWLLWPGHSQSLLRTTAPGLYRIRVQLSGVPSFKGRLPHLAVWHTGLRRSIAGQDVRAAEDQPTTLEIETFLPEGTMNLMNESPGMFSDTHTLSNTRFTFRSSRTTPQPRPTGYKFFLEDGRPIYPLLMIDWIETEGPIQLPADEQKREALLPPPGGGLAESRAALRQLAERAWRRPVAEAELARYTQIVEAELAAGEPLATAHRAAMVAILASKNFYYLEEGSAAQPRDRVNDFELASRLSYFLWSSLPDDELRAAAAAGSLHQPHELRAQLTRMLADPKIARFTRSFPRQWLQLHRVGQFPADPELYPDYDRWLETSMVEETTRYFDAVFRENRSLREFLVSNWTILNPRLALHYGLPPLPETGFQKVALRPEDHRGGLLTHASILSLTSDGTRHRPVHRGVWVSEAVFGRTPPPPPPNVEPLEPTPSDQPKATIRQQLEAHATHATCAACHRQIDPLGFAFDSYDAIGRWRTEERVQGGQGDHPPVNARGALPDGRPFEGTEAFKELLAQDLDRFAEAFVEQLATYALRRVMTIDDRAALQSIARNSRDDGYRLRTVIENLVASDLFQRR